jgi:hypothetical protein
VPRENPHLFDQLRVQMTQPLTLNEQKWRSFQPLLEKNGYILRPRYHPDWAPSPYNKLSGASELLLNQKDVSLVSIILLLRF